MSSEANTRLGVAAAIAAPLVAALALALAAAPASAKNVLIQNDALLSQDRAFVQAETRGLADDVIEERLGDGRIRREIARDGVVAVFERGPGGTMLSFQGERPPSRAERREMIAALEGHGRDETLDEDESWGWGWLFGRSERPSAQEQFRDLYELQTGEPGFESRRRANEALAEALIDEHLQQRRGWFD